MICVSLAETTVAGCLKALEGVGLAEVRLDRMRIGAAGVAAIFSRHPLLIATCRPGATPEAKRRRLLLAAVEAGAAFVDLELDAEARFRDRLVRAARGRNARVIISHHDFRRTPPRPELEAIVGRAFEIGADVAKIALATKDGPLLAGVNARDLATFRIDPLVPAALRSSM